MYFVKNCNIESLRSLYAYAEKAIEIRDEWITTYSSNGTQLKIIFVNI
jgi:hypothetical protein